MGEGYSTTIGLLDSSLVGDTTIASQLNFAGGYIASVNSHGAGVASLLMAPHDDRGLMGLAPMASLVAYNPFDESGTANWEDVRIGVGTLVSHGADVINMSLGVGRLGHGRWLGHRSVRPRRNVPAITTRSS